MSSSSGGMSVHNDCLAKFGNPHTLARKFRKNGKVKVTKRKVPTGTKKVNTFTMSKETQRLYREMFPDG